MAATFMLGANIFRLIMLVEQLIQATRFLFAFLLGSLNI